MMKFVSRHPFFAFVLVTVAACFIVGPRAVGHTYGHAASVAVGYVASFLRGVWGGI